MLGKLIKHEFRAKRGMYLGICIFVVIATVLQCIMLAIKESNVFSSGSAMGSVITVMELLTMLTLMLAILVMLFAPFVIGVTRYYENLVKDEGYLMHTIPVSAWQLHIAKLIVPLVWFFVGIVLTLLAVQPITENTLTLANLWESVTTWEHAGKTLLILGYMLLSIIMSFSMYYACVNLGSLSYKNKGVMAFVSYLVIYMINQVINAVVMLVTILIAAAGSGDIMSVLNSDVVPDGVMEAIIAAAGIVAVVNIVVCNVISVHILKNKINLE